MRIRNNKEGSGLLMFREHHEKYLIIHNTCNDNIKGKQTFILRLNNNVRNHKISALITYHLAREVYTFPR